MSFTCEFVTLHDHRDVAEVGKLRILCEESSQDYTGGPNDVITGFLDEERIKSQRQSE